MTRTGKIARLPQPIRDQVNLAFRNGIPAVVLMRWLNSQPEVQFVLAQIFGKFLDYKQASSRRAGDLETSWNCKFFGLLSLEYQTYIIRLIAVHMKSFASFALFMGVLIPLLLIFEEITVGSSMRLDVMAQNLYGVSPKGQVSDNDVISIPAKGVLNWAMVMQNLAKMEETRSTFFDAVILVLSAIIIILSVHILRNTRGKKTEAG